MVIDRLIKGGGTPEAEWLAGENPRGLPIETAAGLVPAGRRLVVCAPHPDDEILPCAGLVAAAFDLGRPVMVIALTDGEASHGASSTTTPDWLRRTRPAETNEAMHRLGVTAEVRRLGLPDGGLANLEGALRREFERRFRRSDVVIAPWELDGHPDHEAATRAARQAATIVGCEILETPIWGWHWSRPEETPMPWKSGVRFVLDDSQFRRKQAAIGAFRSQLESPSAGGAILTPATLERFARPWEVYFR